MLYVPDLGATDPCTNASKPYIPKNATRWEDIPGVNFFKYIALAPWISPSCSLSLLNSAALLSTQAFIFYTPDNKTDLPPPISSPVWNMNDGGQWKSTHHFPVYAIPGSFGHDLMMQSSLYSGNVSSAPFGKQLLADGVDPNNFVRIYTVMTTNDSQGTLPGLWVFLLIAIASLGACLMLTSFCMHFIQRRRRQILRRRIAAGEINLEALGIKRLKVPVSSIQKMPLFIYMCETTTMPPESSNKGASKGDEEEVFQVPVINDPVSGLTIQPQMYQPQSQPTCPICLDDYESLKSVIRELPCGHIYHPECIDHFLSKNSSLCPMCKKSALPIGYCPSVITNAMVRRERITRLLRENAQVPHPDDWRGRARHWYNRRRIGERESQHVSSVELQTRHDTPPAVSTASAANIPEGASRRAIVELRSQELMGNTVVSDEAVDERQRPKCMYLSCAINDSKVWRQKLTMGLI
jgi:hypothetical protein